MKNDEKIEDLLKHWMMFRDEELSLLSNEDNNTHFVLKNTKQNF